MNIKIVIDIEGKMTDIVYLSDEYKDISQEEYDYCKEHWGESE